MKKISTIFIFSWFLSLNIFAQITHANFSYRINGSMLILHDSSFSDSGVDSMKWDFGDGSKDILTNPIHTYSNPGTYTVCLLVKSRDLTTDSKCMDILIPLNISGNIYETDILSVNSKVYLLNMDSTSTINIIDSIITTDGRFSFNAQKKGMYSLFAVPSTASNTVYHSTYYGNVAEMKFATWLNLTNEAGSIDVHLLKNSEFTMIPDKEQNIRVCPNPVSDKLYISGSGKIESIEIINISGNCMIKIIPMENTAEINMENFSSGIYLIRITKINSQVICKIIKQ